MVFFECARLFPRLRLDRFEDVVKLTTAEQDETSSTDPALAHHKVLLDIVGARGLARHVLETDRNRQVDPYCLVRVSGKLVHRTRAIKHDSDPIWTVRSDSLCLLSLMEHDTVSFEIKNGQQSLGTLELCVADIDGQTGERMEYTLQPVSTSHRALSGKALLALKFRPATEQDIDFFRKRHRISTTISEDALDVNFHHVKGNPRLKKKWKVDWKDLETVYRVKPCPDPGRVKETEFLNQKEIEVEAKKPSTHWVSAGVGSAGTISLEILGCDNLPNLDVQSKTDSFVAVVFEDNCLRTNVLWDCLSPRWMPWTSRAFRLQVRHPGSLLMIGVFDYDRTPLEQLRTPISKVSTPLDKLSQHDPIGRVVIHPAHFASDTTYVLTYRLSHDPRRDDSTRGTITIRMRIEWQDTPVVLKAPPRFVIHVDNERSYHVVRYITRGFIDMEKSSLTSVKLYGKELLSYWSHYCYFLDVLFEVWLWRGQVRLNGYNLWFPIHSLVLFVSFVLCLEYPHKIVPIALYGLAWTLLSIQYHISRHPNPWKRVVSLDQRLFSILTGQSPLPRQIQPGVGEEEERRLEQLDAMKASRMSNLIQSTLMFGLSVYRIYSKQSELALSLTTEQKDWSLLADRLYYLHLMLKYLCTYIRLFRNMINWKGSTTQRVTLYSVVLATMWIILPVDRVVRWAFRFWVWTFLGPWMALVDRCWVRHWYRSKDQLLEAIDSGDAARTESSSRVDLPDMDAWLRSDVFLRMGLKGRVVAEEAWKQRAMREVLLGQYSERIPVVDSSRYPSIPILSQSFAQPQRLEAAHEEWSHVPGQELTGSIILTLHSTASSL